MIEKNSLVQHSELTFLVTDIATDLHWFMNELRTDDVSKVIDKTRNKVYLRIQFWGTLSFMYKDIYVEMSIQDSLHFMIC